MKESSVNFSFCPVPKEQQPVNEYEQLKDSWFFSWPTLESPKYWQKLFWAGFWFALLISPIAAASFPARKQPILFAIAGLMGTLLSLVLLILRQYLGWSYVADRLRGEKVIYEESGWYDGQVWKKPPEILLRDRLIVSYEIQPLLQRLQKTGLILALAIAVDLLLWLWQANLP